MPCYSSYSNNNAHCSYMGPLRSPYAHAAAGYAQCSNMGPLYRHSNNNGPNNGMNNGMNNGLINNGGNNGGNGSYRFKIGQYKCKCSSNGLNNGINNGINGINNGVNGINGINNGVIGEIVNGVDALSRGRFSRYR